MRLLTPSLVLTVCALSAHDIPSDVTVQMLARVAGSRLEIRVRTPLAVVRDLEFSERPDGYLDVEKLAPLLPDVAKVWIADSLEVRENGTPVGKPSIAAARLSLPSDRSFDMTLPPLDGSAKAVWNQVSLDILLEYPIASAHSAFSIHPAFQGLGERVVTALRYTTPTGAERAFQFTGDPGLVPLDPGWLEASLRFVRLGFLHILDGTDHLLFLLCLVIPLRRLRPLVLTVSAFTVAHSFTLLASAYDLAPGALWFPPLVETLIAVSIVCLALENIATTKRTHRWMAAFAFGLIHGFGFSFALRENLQFAGSHLLAGLLSFNIGVELGQLTVLLFLVPILAAAFRWVVAERMGTILLSAIVAHTAWHWMLERGAVLRRFQPPSLDAAFLAGAAQWTLAVLLLAGLVWLASRRPGRVRFGQTER